jgi:hypothetical protein
VKLSGLSFFAQAQGCSALGLFHFHYRSRNKEECMTASLMTDLSYAGEDDLPPGIYPEAHPESCYHSLQQQGLACTRLNAELFYEMGQIQRNRLIGCSTEELRDIDLWDQLSGMSLWDEPLWKMDDRLLAPEETLDNLNRRARWEHVERFFNQVHEWCRQAAAPEILPYRNRRAQSTWRFRRLTWDEAGIRPPDSLAKTQPASPTEILHAAWNYLFWSRRRWLKVHAGRVWLSEHCLRLIRHAFRALLTKFAIPRSDWPDIKEEPKLSWPTKIEALLAELEARERRALERLHQLQEAGLLTVGKLRRALNFLDDLADEMALAQRRLDEAIVKLARQNGYDEAYWGTTIEQFHLSPDELLELREEMRLITAEDQTLTGESSITAPIFQPPAQPDHILLTPAT